jgi:hypothetical protein
MPTIYLIGGCNGAGKTTFAKEFLPTEVNTCSTIIFRWPAGGRFGTAAACPRNGWLFRPDMILNPCES